MSPLLETFGNASKRGWAVASLGINGWFGYVTTGETYGYSTSFDASGNVIAGFRDQTDSAVPLFMKLDSNLGTVLSQKRANNGQWAPGGGAGDGTYFYTGAGNYVSKYDASLNEQASVTEGSGVNLNVTQIAGNYFALGAYNLASNGIIVYLYNKTLGKVWGRKGGTSNGSTGSENAVASVNGYVYVISTNPTNGLCITVLNLAGNKVTDIVPAPESFSSYCLPQTDASDNMVVGLQGASRYLIKYSTAGAIVWQRKITGTGSGIGTTAINGVDPSGNVYTAWVTSASLYILKYNSSGTLLWQRSITKASGTFGGNGSGNIAFTADGQYLSIAGSGGSGFGNGYVIKLSTSGAGLGTYAVNGVNWTYAASSLTDATATTSNSPSSPLTFGTYTTTQTSASPGYTATSFGWTTKVF